MAAKQPSVWRGTKDLVLGKAHWDKTGDKTVVTTNVQGPYDKIISDTSVQIGQLITGFGTALKVTQIEITELDGDAGRADITMEAKLDDSTFDSAPLGEPTYEIEWSSVIRPIEFHPRCGRLNPGRKTFPDAGGGVGKQRTWEDWTSLTGTGDDKDYDNSFSRGPAAPTIWTLTEYKQLREMGVDSYEGTFPTIRRTTIHFYKPNDVGAGCGRRQTPPTAANFTDVAHYEWLGGPDRCTKSRRTYTRTTEWTGLEYWEHLLYAAA